MAYNRKLTRCLQSTCLTYISQNIDDAHQVQQQSASRNGGRNNNANPTGTDENSRSNYEEDKKWPRAVKEDAESNFVLITEDGQKPRGPRANLDRGAAYFPGHKPRANNAPQSLDHFKRGYKERAAMREREEVFLLQHQQGPRGGGSGRHTRDWRRHEQLPDSMRKADQPFILQGFNVTEWIERNSGSHAHAEAALSDALKLYPDAFQSGKVSTRNGLVSTPHSVSLTPNDLFVLLSKRQ